MTRKSKHRFLPKNHPARSAHRKGFALIATLLLMILLALLTVGTLTLSTVTIRSAQRGSAQAEARANARMALMIAIGELQKQMGPDQRISANANIFDDPETEANEVANPHWVGVWDSWIAGDLTKAPVNPNYPSAASHHQTIGSKPDAEMHPDYASENKHLRKNKHFRRWLVSLDPNNVASPDAAKSIDLNAETVPLKNSSAVRLVGENTTNSTNSSDYADVGLIDVSDVSGATTGRYGWWVGDESQKARIMDDSYETQNEDLTSAEKIYRQQAPGSMGNTAVPGMENVTDESQLVALPSLGTLDLVANVTDKTSQQNFHNITTQSLGVLADVREGGLKRDLNTILEQPISLENNGQEYMLYEFDDPRFPYLNNPNDERRANSRVPIQDLAAYYQLYDHQTAFQNGRREGVQYTSTELPDSLQIKAPDYDGGSKDRQRLIREYTSLYREPVVTKIQFLLGITAQEVTQEERDWVKDVVDGTIDWGSNNDETRRGWGDEMDYMRDSDTLKLKLGVQPMVTLWNPSNLPLVMEANQILRYNAPPFGIKYKKIRAEGGTFESRWMNLGYANDYGGGTSAGQGGGTLLELRLTKDTVVFEPGEVKVFSIPSSTAAYLTGSGDNEKNTLDLGREIMDVVNEWDPFGVFLMKNSAPVNHYGTDSPDVYAFDNNGQKAQTLVLSPNDSILVSIDSESAATASRYDDGRNASRSAEIKGAAFSLYMLDEGYQVRWQDKLDSLRHRFMISRHTSGANTGSLGGFYRQLMVPGFPGGEAPIDFDGNENAIPGSQLELAGEENEIIALMDFSLSLGSETSSAASGGFGGGRRITSRPFLHSANAAMPFISESDKSSLYDYGWDWQISKINAVEDSILQAEPETGNGYYGGGYTIENGNTHVIQSEVPVLPPISLASLSHAHLGGFSLAKAIPVGENPDTDTYWSKSTEVKDPSGVAYQRTTASGQNGLAPHIVQAVGNSYAHPNIPADKAFITKSRTFDLDEGAFDIPYVDHSYLANKALWDEFFFSSITPQPDKIPLFGGTARTAKEVADDFFQLSDDSPSIPLPNRRITAYTTDLEQDELNALFEEAELFEDGLADKIAAHLMVEGAFNINSTSVDAWKIFLSSLKGKPVAYLDGGTEPEEFVGDDTTVSPSSLPNGQPVKSSEISMPNTPPEQWTSGRELTDMEIGQLAKAIVYQVKRRGPFLSLSEFVNRRLDGGSPYLSSKGALQAALDYDPDVLSERFSETPPAGLDEVTINANFRQTNRILDSESADISFDFQEAAEGPVAYGSAAYVDQADILRSFAGQLTPRGDTFVVRAYGDSLDSKGNVTARAWCEAVIQRVPEYVDITDEPHLKQNVLNLTNKNFGRKFLIKSFRWLNSEEV